MEISVPSVPLVAVLGQKVGRLATDFFVPLSVPSPISVPLLALGWRGRDGLDLRPIRPTVPVLGPKVGRSGRAASVLGSVPSRPLCPTVGRTGHRATVVPL